MASSGWQGQKDIQTSKYPHMALNLNVSDVKHVGTTVTFKATVRAIVTSGNIYYNNVAISLTGGGSISKNMNPVSTGGSVDFATYSCTVTGVSASATTCNVTASLNAGSVASGSATWTLQVGASYNIPSNFTVANLIPEWNAVTGTYTVGNWGGDPWQYFATRVLNQDPELIGHPRTENQFLNTSATTQSTTVTTRITNDSIKLEGGVVIKGCGQYWSDIYAMNTAGETNSSNVMFYTAPAPVSVTYTDQTNTGSRTYPVKVTGDLVNNHTTYDTANLTRYVRYQVDGGAWQVVENNSVKTLDAVTSFNITVPAGKTAVIESYMTYHGVQSEVNVTTITNGAKPTNLYGSVNGRAKALRPVYGAYGNYFNSALPLCYASSNNVKLTVDKDYVRAENINSTAGSYRHSGFRIVGTDELIGKKVTLSAEFKTSGNFTSAARLWWLNSSNNGLLSGPVSSIEIVKNSGSYSISGTIPARPSGAGDLAVLLYSNVASQGKGVYTDYTKVELKPDVSNMFDIHATNFPATKSGVTASLGYDDTVSVTGILTANYANFCQKTITDQLEDGGLYIMSESGSSPANLYMQINVLKKDGTSQYPNTTGGNPRGVLVNKRLNSRYQVQIQTGTSATWGTASKTVTGKFKLERCTNLPIDIINWGAHPMSGTKNGITYSVDHDGRIRVNGTATAATHINIPFKIPASLVGKRCSSYVLGDIGGLENIGLKTSSTSDVSGTVNLGQYGCATFTITQAIVDSVALADVYIASGKSVDNANFYFRFGEGDMSTEYAPPVQTKAHRLRKIYASVNGATKLIYTE